MRVGYLARTNLPVISQDREVLLPPSADSDSIPAMNRNFILLSIAYLVLAGGAVGYLLLSGKILEGSKIDDPTRIAMGGDLYQANCASCHGADLEGQANWRTPKSDGKYPASPLNENGRSWIHSGFQMFDIIKVGGATIAPRSIGSDMPAFESKLDNKQIWAVIDYIKSRWPAKIREINETANLFGGFCVSSPLLGQTKNYGSAPKSAVKKSGNI